MKDGEVVVTRMGGPGAVRVDNGPLIARLRAAMDLPVVNVLEIAKELDDVAEQLALTEMVDSYASEHGVRAATAVLLAKLEKDEARR